MAYSLLKKKSDCQDSLQTAIDLGEKEMPLITFDVYHQFYLAKTYLAAGRPDDCHTLLRKITASDPIPPILTGFLEGLQKLAEVMPGLAGSEDARGILQTKLGPQT